MRLARKPLIKQQYCEFFFRLTFHDSEIRFYEINLWVCTLYYMYIYIVVGRFHSINFILIHAWLIQQPKCGWFFALCKNTFTVILLIQPLLLPLQLFFFIFFKVFSLIVIVCSFLFLFIQFTVSKRSFVFPK